MNVLECPHCGRQFGAVPAVMGRTIRCRGCERMFLVPSDGLPTAAPTAATSAPDAALGGIFQGTAVRSCPTCGHTFAMQPRLAGKAIRCRKCRSTFRVLNEAERATAVEGARLPEAVQPTRGPLPTEHEDSEPTVPRSDALDDAGEVISAAEADQAARSMWLLGASSFPRRLNRRSGSGNAGGFGELIAVLVGGLLAFPVSQFICWWGLNWDPFGVARGLRPELQWLAPEHLFADPPDTK